MKLNLKHTFLASSLILLSLTRCATSENPSIELSVPSISATKTTGHKAEIIQSAKKIFHVNDLFTNKIINKDSLETSMTFSENNYNSETDSFDISNVNIIDKKDHANIHMDRMIKDSNKSLQMINLKIKDMGSYSKTTYLTMKKFILLGDFTSQSLKNINIGISAQGIIFPKIDQYQPITAESINLFANINDKGIEKFNLNTNNLNLGNRLAEKTEDLIQSLTGNYAIYKTNNNPNDNNYTLNANTTMGYDSQDKSKISQSQNIFNFQLDNKFAHNLILHYIQHPKIGSPTDRQSMEIFNSKTKLVSFIINFKNNGLLNALYVKHPLYKTFNESTKAMAKMMLKKYQVIDDQKVDNLLDVISNTLNNNKDLNATLKAITPSSLKDIMRKIQSGEKAITIDASN